MGFAAVLAVTLTPALAALLIRGSSCARSSNPLNRGCSRVYAPVVRLVVELPLAVIVAAALPMVLTVPALPAASHDEFMPPLNEGAILYMPTAPPGMSIKEASQRAADHGPRAQGASPR